MNKPLSAGWGWPFLSRKAHFYSDGEAISLCGKWMHTGPRDNSAFESNDDCAACRRKLNKEQKNGKSNSPGKRAGN